MASVGALRPVGLRRRLPWALGNPMKIRQFIALCLLVLACNLQAQPSVQRSHIEANVPEERNFHAILRRDLLAYLKAREPGLTDLLQIDLLRDAPTQSGASYPKYYVWVKYRVGAMKVKQGALRLAAIEKSRFEVTNFVSAGEAKQDRKAVEQVFPSALVPDILSRASKL